MSSQDDLKKIVAKEAIKLIKNVETIGVGTGSTVNYFIEALAEVKPQFDTAVASSVATEKLLKSQGIRVEELNSVSEISIYVDGADEFNQHGYLIKGGGGALTREKIVAAASKQFVCIVDESKQVDVLGKFPLPIEVIPMARSYVAREMIKLKGDPVYREGVVTDNGNVILDVFNLKIIDPIELESVINDIPGVVSNGIFAKRGADKLLIGTGDGVRTLATKKPL